MRRASSAAVASLDRGAVAAVAAMGSGAAAAAAAGGGGGVDADDLVLGRLVQDERDVQVSLCELRMSVSIECRVLSAVKSDATAHTYLCRRLGGSCLWW